MNPLIFREYDIRGDASRDLDDALIEDLGRALGTRLQRQGHTRIVVCRDCRLSSDRLHAALTRGMLATGLRLVDIGVGATPMMYFTVFDQDTDGGVQITGSHNPKGDNGFKMMAGKQALSGTEVRDLRMMIETRDFDLRGGGSVEYYDPIPSYAAYMRGNINLARTDLRFAVDAGNGTGGPITLAAMRALGLSPDAMHCEMDGNFPNHHPDPSELENVKELKRRVIERGYEFGIAYDGDADRIGLIDDLGNVIWGDKLMILMSRAILARQPGAAIIGEVKCSQTLYDDIAGHGGRPIVWKTGHSLIKKKMKEEGALLAGEMSGHMFFADKYFGFDDAIYAALRVCEIIAASDRPLSQLLADVPPTYSTPELRVDCSDEKKFQVVSRVLSHFRASHDVLDIDGARITFANGWGLVRASNTQPSLVMRFEATDESSLAGIRQTVESVVTSVST